MRAITERKTNWRLLNRIKGDKRTSLLLRIFYKLFDIAVIGAVLIVFGLFYIYEYGEAVVSRHPDKLLLAESSTIVASDGTILRRVPLPESGYRITAELDELPELLLNTYSSGRRS